MTYLATVAVNESEREFLARFVHISGFDVIRITFIPSRFPRGVSTTQVSTVCFYDSCMYVGLQVT